MTLLMLLFWLIAGGTLQVVVPAWRHMGQPAFPILLGVVIYAATNKKFGYFLLAALIAGVLGFSGVAGTASSIAWILFVVFLILAAVSFFRKRA